jgi:hypothetical protein
MRYGLKLTVMPSNQLINFHPFCAPAPRECLLNACSEALSGCRRSCKLLLFSTLSPKVPLSHEDCVVILDISGKAAHALRQYLQLVVTNYELAMDEQNARDRQDT